MASRTKAFIGTDMPDEPSIRALTVGAQWLYDRLLLSPELSRCGVLPLRLALWSDRAPDATEKKVQKWLGELVTGRHVVVDERYAEVLVRTYVRHDGLLGQPNVVAAMVDAYRVTASPRIQTAFLAEFRRLWDLDLEPGARGGWCLAVGHYPEPKQGKDDHRAWPAVLPGDSLARLRKSIGDGIFHPLGDAISEGHVPAFTEATGQGIPEPFDRTLPRTPSRGRDRGERRTPTPTPTPTPGAVASPDPADPSGPSSSGGDPAQPLLEEHLAQVGPITAGAARQHHERITECLAAGGTPEQIRLTLAEWRRRPGAKPGLIPHIFSDVVRGHTVASDDPLAHPDAQAWLAAQQAGAAR